MRLKDLYPPTSPHGIKIQKTNTDIFTAMGTSNVTSVCGFLLLNREKALSVLMLVYWKSESTEFYRETGENFC